MEARADYCFTEKFYEYKRNAEEFPQLDFPLPVDDNLYDFFRAKQGQAYCVGCNKAIAEISQFCASHQLNCDNLHLFARRYLEYSGNDDSENKIRMPLYTEGMTALVNIARLIAHPQINNCIDIIRRLIEGLDRCPTGTHTHIINTQCDLLAQLNLGYSLMTTRKVIAEQCVLELLHDENVMIGMEIHYVNAVLQEFQDVLHIDVIDDETTELCLEDRLQDIYDRFTIELPQLLSLDKLLTILLRETNYEALPESIKQKGYQYSAEFVAGLNFYGQESPVSFMQLDDVIESKDDYVSFQLCWSAKHVLTLSLLHRLCQSGMIDLTYQSMEFEGSVFYYLPSQSLALAYVYDEADVDGKKYQPLLIYFVKNLLRYPDHIERLLTRRPFKQHRYFFEIVNTMIEYYAYVAQDEREKYVFPLKQILNHYLTIPEVLSLQHADFIKLYFADIGFNKLNRYAKKDKNLLKLIAAMHVANAADYLTYLYKRGRIVVNQLSMLEVAASYGLYSLAELILLSSKKSSHQRRLNSAALRLSCEKGHIDIVTLLLVHGHIDIDDRSIAGYNALHLAAMNNHLGVVDLLLEHGASVNMRSWNNESPLYFAVTQPSVAMVKLLLSANANPDHLSPTGKSLLKKAKYHYEISAELIYFGAEVNDSSIVEWLLPEIVKRHDVNLAACLLTAVYPGFLDYANDDNETPLYLAAVHSSHQVARMLLKKDVDVNGVEGKCPLHVAIKKQDVEMILLLLEFHADPELCLLDKNSIRLALDTQNPVILRLVEIQTGFYSACSIRSSHFSKAILRLLQHAAKTDKHVFALTRAFIAFKLLMQISFTGDEAAGELLANINNTIKKACKHFASSGYIQSSWIESIYTTANELHTHATRSSMSQRLYSFFGVKQAEPSYLFTLNIALSHLRLFRESYYHAVPGSESNTKRIKL